MPPVLVLSVVTLPPDAVNPVVVPVVVPATVVLTVVPLPVSATVLLLAPSTGKVCTASAFPTLAPGSENTALAVRQHLVFSAADSQQYAAGAAYPSP